MVTADLALPVGVGRAIGRMRGQNDANPTADDRVKVYTEWLFRSPAGSSLPNFDNMGEPAIAAAWLNKPAQKADWLPKANVTVLVDLPGFTWPAAEPT